MSENLEFRLPPIIASAITGPIATCIFQLQMNGAAVASGMGTCGLVGQIGVYTGWLNDIAAGTKMAVTIWDWIGLISISFLLPAILTYIIFDTIIGRKGKEKDNMRNIDNDNDENMNCDGKQYGNIPNEKTFEIELTDNGSAKNVNYTIRIERQH